MTDDNDDDNNEGDADDDGDMVGMGGVVVCPLASHRYVPSSSPGRIVCELSLFDVLFSPVPRGFFSGFSGFPPSVKLNM